MDLYDRLGPGASLDGCEKLSASTYIELLGLINSSPGVARPTFDSSEVTEFYRETQEVVVATAAGSIRSDVLQELRDGKLFQDEAELLLREYGPRIWGDDRSDLISATTAATALYPKDLYFNRKEDYLRIVFYVRCWMAKRALRKASEAPKGTTTNTGNTPKKRKRASASTSTSMTTEGAISKKLQRKSTGLSDDGAIPPGSTRKRSARASAIHYAEDNDEDEEDRSFEDEEEAEAEGGAQEVRHWREPSVASDNLTPAAHATHWKRQARHSDPTQDRSRSGSASKPSRVVKLPVDKKKLTVFQAWDGWREYDGHAQTNSPPVGAHVLPPNPYAQSSNPPPTGHAVDIPKQYIDKSAGERSGSRPAEGAPYQQREMAAEPVRQDFINPTPTGFQAINRRPVDPSPQVEHRVQLPPPPPPPVESQPLVSRSNTEQTSPNLPTQPHPTHAASRPSSSSTGHPGGEENLLKRRQIFSTLIDLLKSPVPSNVVSVSLEPLIESIWTEAEDDYMMQVFSEDDLPRVTKAFTSWISLHETLESFRQRTRYYGRSGDEWQRFRRSLGFLERVPMMEAMNELGQMRLRQIDAGDWFDETTFDRDLAAFLGALTRIPGVGAEDLEDGFAGYNKELLAWFY